MSDEIIRGYSKSKYRGVAKALRQRQKSLTGPEAGEVDAR
jgi:hypothetical protein